MKNGVFVAAILAGSGVFAAPCPDTTVPADRYYIQTASQTMMRGPGSASGNPLANMISASRSVQQNLADLDSRELDTVNFFGTTFSHYIQYQFAKDFRPNCLDSVPAGITYWQKDTGRAAVFSTVPAAYPHIMFWDSTFLWPQHPEYKGWFGFYRGAALDTLSGFLGRLSGESVFSNWYGVAVLLDSSRASSTQPWSASISVSNSGRLFGPVDSAYLDSLFLVYYPWRSTLALYGTNRHPYLRMLTFKLSYDTTAPLSLRPPRLRAGAHFSAWRQGNTVWIHLGRDAARGESVELFDMFGRKTAELRPTGRLYAWDGINQGGYDAPPGLYFVRAGGRILGKFVYGR